MPYKLKQTNPGSIEVTTNLESFWFLYNFNVDQGTKKVDIKRGYFAAYISQASGNPFIQSLYGDSNEIYRKLEISKDELKISINNVRLVDSRFSQFSNEVSQLHLFDFSVEPEHKKEWIDTKGWTPKVTNPTRNNDNTFFLKHTLDFGQVQERYIYWLSTQANGNGTERFVLALPFIANSLMGTILALHKQDLPTIQLSVNERPWTYPSGQELSGAINGFVMVAEGAFKAIALSAEVDNLIKQVTSDTPSEDIIANLSQIIHRYPTPISRTMSTAPNTKSNSVVPSSPELPIEVLYLEGLNSTNPVDMIIQ